MGPDVEEDAWARLAATAVPGGALLRARPLSGGLSAHMTALDIALPGGGQRTVIARQGPALARQARLLRLAWAQGLAVPQVVAYVTGASGAPFLLLDHIAGEMSFAPPDLPRYLREAAAQLAAIHRLTPARVDLSFLPLAGPGCAATPAAHAAGALDTARAAASLRAHGPPNPGNPPALLHGDYWPGNLIWRDGRLAAVIDWEDAALGDPLLDLAISRLDIACIYGWAALDDFTRAYRAQRPLDYRALPYWDLCAALRLARLVGDDLDGWAAFFGPFGRADITGAGIRAAYTIFTAQALAALTA